jgi:hypothetical protein
VYPALAFRGAVRKAPLKKKHWRVFRTRFANTSQPPNSSRRSRCRKYLAFLTFGSEGARKVGVQAVDVTELGRAGGHGTVAASMPQERKDAAHAATETRSERL